MLLKHKNINNGFGELLRPAMNNNLSIYPMSPSLSPNQQSFELLLSSQEIQKIKEFINEKQKNYNLKNPSEKSPVKPKSWPEVLLNFA